MPELSEVKSWFEGRLGGTLFEGRIGGCVHPKSHNVPHQLGMRMLGVYKCR